MLCSKSERLPTALPAALSSGALAQDAASKPTIDFRAVMVNGSAAGADERRANADLRIEAYGAIEEVSCAIGLARVATATELGCARIDAMLLCAQNDLFDLGADLCARESDADRDHASPRIVPSQVDRLERKIDELNGETAPLHSFVLPGGSAAAAALHLARAVTRRAERLLVALAKAPGEKVREPAIKYMNRLSDFLFVAARHVNRKGEGDVVWVPGRNSKSS